MIIIGPEPKNEEEKKLFERYIHYENEQIWKRNTLDSIEPGMTKERVDELKITMKINLLDEQYEIRMDGKLIGDPFPMFPGMLEELMWGKNNPERKKKIT